MFVTGGPPPTPILSDERICDSNLFARQVNALGHYLTAIQQSPRTPTQPESPTDYWSMSTSELEDLAHKYQIGGYGYSVHGGVDRQTIIDALLKRDRAIRADTPAPRQTINVGKCERLRHSARYTQFDCNRDAHHCGPEGALGEAGCRAATRIERRG